MKTHDGDDNHCSGLQERQLRCGGTNLALRRYQYQITNYQSLLLGQVEKPFSKSMLNRKVVFRVTKSQSMKDKLSFILYYMIILTGGWRVEGVWGGNIHVFSGGLSENECKYLNERDHKMSR